MIPDRAPAPRRNCLTFVGYQEPPPKRQATEAIENRPHKLAEIAAKRITEGVRHLFAAGPLTVDQIHAITGRETLRSNTQIKVTDWAKRGLIEVVSRSGNVKTWGLKK